MTSPWFHMPRYSMNKLNYTNKEDRKEYPMSETKVYGIELLMTTTTVNRIKRPSK